MLEICSHFTSVSQHFPVGSDSFFQKHCIQDLCLKLQFKFNSLKVCQICFSPQCNSGLRNIINNAVDALKKLLISFEPERFSWQISSKIPKSQTTTKNLLHSCIFLRGFNPTCCIASGTYRQNHALRRD